MIRFVFTASILNPEREQLYVSRITRTIKQLRHLHIPFYIVENGGKRLTGLDSIEGASILYTDINRLRFVRKGINECMDILSLAEYFSFSDDDIIIKLTGLYTLNQSCIFIEKVLQNISRYDVFIKFFNICTNKFDKNDCVLGLFAIRYSKLQDFNFMQMLNHPSMEAVFAQFVKEEIANDRIYEVEMLDLEIQGDSEHVV